MKSACEQTELFTDAKAEPIAAEYLFTVEVAKAIAKLNGPPGDPYVIRVERDADVFATDCLKPMAGGQGDWLRGKMVFRRSKPDVGRSGRIDVTVYADEPNSSYWSYQPVCAIEVKGFNPAKKLVLDSIRMRRSAMRGSWATRTRSGANIALRKQRFCYSWLHHHEDGVHHAEARRELRQDHARQGSDRRRALYGRALAVTKPRSLSHWPTPAT